MLFLDMRANTRAYGTKVTSYDVIKTIAILTMVIDHIGFYFFPEMSWFRVFGRVSAPMWFFIAGYNLTSSKEKDIWLLGGLLMLFGLIVEGQVLFPVNVLITIAIMRFILRKITVHYGQGSDDRVYYVTLSLAVVYFLILGAIMDYGTMGLLWMFSSWLQRHRADGYGFRVMLVLTGIVYISFEAYLFHFTYLQSLVMGVLVAGTVLMLWHFKPKQLTFSNVLLRFCGRNSHYIYILHVMLFKVAALALL